jgi:peptide/nickel transport system permease protein
MTVQSSVIPQLADDLSTPPLTLTQLGWLRLRRHKMALFGGVMLVLLILFSFGTSFFVTEKYANFNDTSKRLQSPSAEHPFGTDSIGRDVFARTVYGGQISLIIGFVAVLIETVLGILVGALAGYYGGVVDAILMRFTEALLSIPTILLLLTLAKFFGGSVPEIPIAGRTFSGSVVVIIAVIGATSWMYLARIVRAEFLSLKEREFILAARATGTSNFDIIFRHILPNTFAPIIVSSTLSVANAILAEAYISFLGLGVQPPTATWGNMLDNSVKYLDSAPWLWFFPGMLILLTVLSINFLGDGMRDALDPRSRAV